MLSHFSQATRQAEVGELRAECARLVRAVLGFKASPVCLQTPWGSGWSWQALEPPVGPLAQSTCGPGSRQGHLLLAGVRSPEVGCTQPRPSRMTCDPDKLLPKTFVPVPLSQPLHGVAKNLFPPLPPLPALTEGLSTWHHPGSLRKHHPPASSPDSLKLMYLQVTSSSREPSRNHPPPPCLPGS